MALSRQEMWKNKLIARFKERYPALNEGEGPELQQIKSLLDKHWNLCKLRWTSVSSKILGLFPGIRIGANLSPFSPMAGGAVGFFGKVSFMALSYLAVELLSARVLSRISVPLEQLDEHHLTKLLGNARSSAELIRYLTAINEEIETAISKDNLSTFTNALGVAWGAGVQSSLFSNVANEPVTGAIIGAQVMSSVFAGAGNLGSFSIFGANIWSKKLESLEKDEAKHEAKNNEAKNNEGIRQRRPQPAMGRRG